MGELEGTWLNDYAQLQQSRSVVYSIFTSYMNQGSLKLLQNIHSHF